MAPACVNVCSFRDGAAIKKNNDSEAAVLDVQGFAAFARIPKATILTLRSRAPAKLPPPFRLRPLLWRTQTIVRWMEEQEQAELERIGQLQRGTRRKNG